MRVLGYARVSTEGQATNGVGLDAQRDAIMGECERRGLKLVDLVVDAGFSGRNLKRPGLADTLVRLKAGKGDALMVSRLDRLSRSLLDFAGLMATAQNEAWAIIALDIGVDTTTPQGEMVVNVMAAFAQFERRLIGQRTKEALAVKRAQGVVLGRPTVLPAEVSERIRSERASGMTLQAIADGLNRDVVPTAQGGRQWWPSTVRKVIA